MANKAEYTRDNIGRRIKLCVMKKNWLIFCRLTKLADETAEYKLVLLCPIKIGHFCGSLYVIGCWLVYKMSWSDNDVFTLRSFYKGNPWLYDNKLKDYWNKDKNRALEKQVVEELKQRVAHCSCPYRHRSSLPLRYPDNFVSRCLVRHFIGYPQHLYRNNNEAVAAAAACAPQSATFHARQILSLRDQ